MGKKIYGEKISVGMEKRIRYKFIFEHLKVKLHIEILSDAAIFLLLGILGVRVNPSGLYSSSSRIGSSSSSLA